MLNTFAIVSVNISRTKGTIKEPVPQILLKPGHGVEGDAHAGPGHRQVSLLAQEDIDAMRAKGASVSDGSFAENITTRGMDLPALPVGTRLTIGGCVLEISQIGKQCHTGCAIMKQVGDCVMPKRGVFAIVINEGVIKNGDTGTYDI